MKKIEKAKMIVDHPMYDGSVRNAHELAKMYTTEELDDALEVLDCIDCGMDWE